MAQTKRKRRRMLSFKLAEISTVDHPAQAGARVMLMKKDTQKGGAHKMASALAKNTDDLPAAIVKMYIDVTQGAVPFSAILQQFEDEEDYRELMQIASPLVSALEMSLRSIIADKTKDGNVKQTMLRSTVEEFLAALREEWPDVEQAIAEALNVESAETSNGEEEMKKVEELEAQVVELTKKLEEASKGSDATKQVETLTAQVTELTTKLATATAEIEKAKKDDEEANKQMSDAETAYHGNLNARDRKMFAAMSRADRKKHMAANKVEDETVEIEGQTISKAAVGDSMFAVLKAQTAKTEQLQKDGAAERDRREFMEFEKRADEELAHLPGTTQERASILKSIAALPEANAKVAMQMLKAGDKALSSAFEKVGVGGQKNDADGSAFNKHVSAIKARDKCTNQEALRKARLEHPDDYKAYQDEGSAV